MPIFQPAAVLNQQVLWNMINSGLDHAPGTKVHSASSAALDSCATPERLHHIHLHSQACQTAM